MSITMIRGIVTSRIFTLIIEHSIRKRSPKVLMKWQIRKKECSDVLLCCCVTIHDVRAVQHRERRTTVNVGNRTWRSK